MQTTPLRAFAVSFLVVSCGRVDPEAHQTVAQSVEGPADAGDAGDAGDAQDSEAGASCAHAPCTTGTVLVPGCDPCAAQVCNVDPYCCTVTWDATCVAEVASVCSPDACLVRQPDAGDSGSNACAHPTCTVGIVLLPSCHPCAAALCAADPYCCSVAWDATCVSEVPGICGAPCP